MIEHHLRRQQIGRASLVFGHRLQRLGTYRSTVEGKKGSDWPKITLWCPQGKHEF